MVVFYENGLEFVATMLEGLIKTRGWPRDKNIELAQQDHNITQLLDCVYETMYHEKKNPLQFQDSPFMGSTQALSTMEVSTSD